MKRRNFLKALFGLLGTVSVASFAYPLVRFLAPPGISVKDKKVTLPKHDVPVGASKAIVFRDKPAMIINRPGKGLIALSKVCTHLGCLVEYEKEKNQLLCPCHAGSYDLEGNVLSGPPPRPLDKLPLRIEGDQIVIG
jgi:cytochrome b6-f complex iron-sulfur subunit